MKLLNFLIIKVTFCLIFGILLSTYLSSNSNLYLILFLATFSLFIIEFVKSKSFSLQKPRLAIVTYLCFVFLGASLLKFHTKVNSSNHYSNFIKTDSLNLCQLKIYKKLKPSKFHNRYLVKVTQVNSISCKGIALINIDSTLNASIDNSILSYTFFKDFSLPKNPHQFNFKSYMNKQNVYHQIYISSKNSQINNGKTSIYGWTDQIRTRIVSRLENDIRSENNLAIIKALLLGQRQDINKNLYTNFSQAGAIHILAISGLHIGIIMLLLSTLLKPLERIRKIKKVIPFIIITLLWFYALIAGLSASIVRAVTMFSLLTIAMYYKRKTNTYNTLFISALTLLLFNPFYLFEVGFQLSYLAVFSILLIKPLFDKLWQPKLYLVKKIYDVFSVSLAAQIGILPLSLLYFHQFPGLFMLSNLIIIPLLGILLIIGFSCLTLAYLNILPSYLVNILEICINSLQIFVEWVAKKEYFLFEEISFNWLNLLSSYLLIGFTIWLFYSFKPKKLIYTLMGLFIFTISLTRNKYLYQQKNEFVIFNQYKNTIYGKRTGQSLVYTSSKAETGNLIKDYVIGEYIRDTKKDSLKNIYQANQQSILIIDKKGIYQTDFRPTVIYLTQSPKINLNRLIKDLNPSLIVYDNNNYKSYQNRWKQTCEKQKIPFHSTNEKGAVVIR